MDVRNIDLYRIYSYKALLIFTAQQIPC